MNIDYNTSTVLIVPISNLPNTNIKRYFALNFMLSSFNTAKNEVRINGTILHKTEQEVNGMTLEVDAAGLTPIQRELVANNTDKVNEQGQLDPNGTIGQYNWLYWQTYYKLISPQEGIIAAIQAADTAGRFNQ
jgi:hypothetical protein